MDSGRHVLCGEKSSTLNRGYRSTTVAETNVRRANIGSTLNRGYPSTKASMLLGEGSIPVALFNVGLVSRVLHKAIQNFGGLYDKVA